MDKTLASTLTAPRSPLVPRSSSALSRPWRFGHHHRRSYRPRQATPGAAPQRAQPLGLAAHRKSSAAKVLVASASPSMPFSSDAASLIPMVTSASCSASGESNERRLCRPLPAAASAAMSLCLVTHREPHRPTHNPVTGRIWGHRCRTAACRCQALTHPHWRGTPPPGGPAYHERLPGSHLPEPKKGLQPQRIPEPPLEPDRPTSWRNGGAECATGRLDPPWFISVYVRSPP